MGKKSKKTKLYIALTLGSILFVIFVLGMLFTLLELGFYIATKGRHDAIVSFLIKLPLLFIVGITAYYLLQYAYSRKGLLKKSEVEEIGSE